MRVQSISLFLVLLPTLALCCSFDMAYITLGGHWSDAKEDTLYVVGVRSRTKCHPHLVELDVVTSTHQQLVKTPILARKYVSEVTKTKRYYYFFNVTTADVQNSECHFNYRVRYRDHSTRIYKFRSDMYCFEYYNIYFLGQHDHSVVGQRATEALMTSNFDLLVLSGNHANFFHTDKFEEGERYLRSIETLITRKPVLVLPGTKESKEDFRPYNYRFWMPFTDHNPTWDFFLISIKNRNFLFLNLQKYINNTFTAKKESVKPATAELPAEVGAAANAEASHEAHVEGSPHKEGGHDEGKSLTVHGLDVKKLTDEEKKVLALLENGASEAIDENEIEGPQPGDLADQVVEPVDSTTLLQRLKKALEDNFDSDDLYRHWKVVVTNVAFYCSNDDDGDTCTNNLYLLKDFDDLFELYKFHLVVNSARKFQESAIGIYDYKRIVNRSKNYLTVGMAGSSSFRGGDERQPSQMMTNSFNNQQAILSMQLFHKYYKLDVLDVPSMLTIDLMYAAKRVRYDQYFTYAALLMILAVIFLMMQVVKVENFKDRLADFRAPKTQKVEEIKLA